MCGPPCGCNVSKLRDLNYSIGMSYQSRSNKLTEGLSTTKFRWLELPKSLKTMRAPAAFFVSLPFRSRYSRYFGQPAPPCPALGDNIRLRKQLLTPPS
ncbi:hypothetical protein ElyMa_002468200 [Elysia marginata]|uniref:Uncharacterized protein n=1 Tax=Elysia marginata TaxID=1093978 RepID=A0AAV4GL04_9GAST|nr:hypothetical protein ElyMa_002468200 [Elysia marginata]